MSHPNPHHDPENEYPADKSGFPKKSIKGQMDSISHKAKKLQGLMHTKHFGAKHGARHEAAKSKALKKKRGESTMPF